MKMDRYDKKDMGRDNEERQRLNKQIDKCRKRQCKCKRHGRVIKRRTGNKIYVSMIDTITKKPINLFNSID